MRKTDRHAMLQGASATMGALFGRETAPANPYPENSKRALFWQWGAERAERLIRDIAGGDLTIIPDGCRPGALATGQSREWC